MGILLETTPNLDNAVEHLAVASKRSLFALNPHCAELCIMDVKLRHDLFNINGKHGSSMGVYLSLMLLQYISKFGTQVSKKYFMF